MQREVITIYKKNKKKKLYTISGDTNLERRKGPVVST